MAIKKPAGTAKPAAAKAAKPAAAAPATDSASDAMVADASAVKAPTLKIKDLVDRVVAQSGARKKDARGIIEATLKVLGDAMAAGEDMNLPGLGRTRVARSTDRDGASHMTLKVKRGAHRPKPAEEPLAEDGEDS